MKLSVLSLSTLIALALAQDGKKLNNIKNMIPNLTDLTDVEARQFILKYGCYCYQADNRYVGPQNNYNGPGVDALDELCRDLFVAQRCLRIDSDTGKYPKTCDADDYFQWYYADGAITCGREGVPAYAARNPCQMDNCELEKDFIYKLSGLINSGFERTDSFARMDDATYATTCTQGAGGRSRELTSECCGTGVARKTFNSLIYTCCDDTITSLGSC